MVQQVRACLIFIRPFRCSVYPQILGKPESTRKNTLAYFGHCVSDAISITFAFVGNAIQIVTRPNTLAYFGRCVGDEKKSFITFSPEKRISDSESTTKDRLGSDRRFPSEDSSEDLWQVTDEQMDNPTNRQR
jgi:hypothetical protein